MRAQVLLLFLFSFAGLSAHAEAKSYTAERFDSRVRVLVGGAIEVTETVVFRFEGGPFTYVFREIPRRGIDSIDVLRATMDGREFRFGDQPGQLELRGGSRLRVRWHFSEPVADATHAFTLTYRAEGAVRQSEEGDLLAWRALPGRHDYSIDHSTIEIEYPAPLARRPAVASNRVDDVQVQGGAQPARVTASGIGRNGWVEARLYFAPGSVIASPPRWQDAQRRADALAPQWMWAAALIGAAGLVLFWSMRSRYDPPPRDTASAGAGGAPPTPVAPAIAGALAGDGRVSLPQAMATLFSLADRGAIVIREEPRSMLGQRHFTLERRRAAQLLTRHEQVALDIAFRSRQGEESRIQLAQARRRLQSHSRRFRDAVHDEMAAAGLIDRERKAVHARYGTVSLGILLLGAALLIVAAVLVQQYRGWPFVVPVAVILVALVGFAFQGATSQLSNEGARHAELWRAYQKHLRKVVRRQAHLGATSPSEALPFAVALGLAAAWATFVKAQPALVPPWFEALSASSDGGAFPAFIAHGGSPGGGGGAGGGGASGGGASGAG